VTSRTDPNADTATPVAAGLASACLGDHHGSRPAGSAVQVHRRFVRARAVWPSRRLIAVAVLAPALAAALVAVGGGRLTTASRPWLALVVVIAVACSATLASYVPRPGAGRRLDVGCTPCASVAALSVVVAAGVLSSDPQDVPTAILALGVAAFGLRQRLTDPSTCAV